MKLLLTMLLALLLTMALVMTTAMDRGWEWRVCEFAPEARLAAVCGGHMSYRAVAEASPGDR